MQKKSPAKTICSFLLLISITAALSHVSTKIWGGKPEEIAAPQKLTMTMDMSLATLSQTNNIPRQVLKKIFYLQNKQEMNKKLADFGMSIKEVENKINQEMALQTEHESKNWIKIPLKFGLWLAFLTMVFLMMRKSAITHKNRRWLYIAGVVLFGVILSADPSPMGTVKDAITLYGAKGVIFRPRMVALSIFLALVLIVNKFICAWGCQAGVLQDLIFRQNRNARDTKGIIHQYKPPFLITNSIRILFFCALTYAAFAWATDIIDPIDPFKIYKPAKLSTVGWIFLAALFSSSLLIYRPWCHLFCPFGLIGWLVEKGSIFRIRVNYDTCTSCGACVKVCPSTVMGAILAQKANKPDCFACGTCINICPTKSIRFTTALGTKQTLPKSEKSK